MNRLVSCATAPAATGTAPAARLAQQDAASASPRAIPPHASTVVLTLESISTSKAIKVNAQTVTKIALPAEDQPQLIALTPPMVTKSAQLESSNARKLTACTALPMMFALNASSETDWTLEPAHHVQLLSALNAQQPFQTVPNAII